MNSKLMALFVFLAVIATLSSPTQAAGPSIDPENICLNENRNQKIRHDVAVAAKDEEIPPESVDSFEVFRAIISRSESIEVKYDCKKQRLVGSLTTFSFTGGDVVQDLGDVTLGYGLAEMNKEEIGQEAFDVFMKEAKKSSSLKNGKLQALKVIFMFSKYMTTFNVLLEPAKDEIRLRMRPDRFGLYGVITQTGPSGKRVFQTNQEYDFMRHASVLIESKGKVTDFTNTLIRKSPKVVESLQIPVTYVLNGLGAMTIDE